MTRKLWVMLLGTMMLIFPRGIAGDPAKSGASDTNGTAPTGSCADIAAEAEQAGGQQRLGFNPADLDRSVRPCEDFYDYAVGGWKKANPIPAAYSRWGSFNILREHNEEVLRTILDEAAKDKSAKAGSNWQKVGDFYASCMDESAIEAAGLKPLEPELERIAAIHDAASFQAEVARLQRMGVEAVFDFDSQQDFKESTRMIAVASQGGLGLPDRDYYTREDDKSKEQRGAYVRHVTNMFKLLGEPEEKAAADAKTVMEIETTLAKSSMTRVDRRDPDKIYHKMSVAELRELAPAISWETFFNEVGAPSVAELNVSQPEFFKEVSAEWSAVAPADWKTYLRWHLVHAMARSLPAKFVEENFDFYGKTLTGTTENLPRWRRCSEATDGAMGQALGQFYVERVFPPEAKAKAIAMVKNLTAALRTDIAGLDWMSAATKDQATKKLDAIQLKIGYPDKWRDYSGLRVERVPYVENVIRSREFDSDFALQKIGKLMDRKEWRISPPTVNAFYSSQRNEIVFPAGILQPPFFDPNQDDAMNYGAMGSVIGHELTHGFDDQGSKFDAEGNRKNWWTPEDLKNFQARGECIVKQFGGFEVEPGLHENGKLVEGESIADLGGLTIAYAALQKTFEGKSAPAAIDGFTPEQRFFLGWATVWEGNTRPEFARLMTQTDPHPLDQFRVNGPLSNMPEFAKAYGCAADSTMVRAPGVRCRIW